MKNTIRLSSFLTLTILFSACQEKPKKGNQEESAKGIDEVVFETPKQIISLEEADSLFVNYKNRRASNIIEMEAAYQEDRKPFVPTQFVSFDIDVLKNYIGYVEQEARKGGTEADSLRIYFGNYGKENKKNARRNTVFLLPTANVNGDYGGVYIDSNGKAKLVRDWIKEQQKAGEGDKQKSEASFMPNFSSAPSLYDGGSLTLNHGGSGPPPKTDF
ncbi:hypothetical protein ACOCEA_00255 [Maribacter sp. CXY002]|uniref:hypothetical protein n=1 Tax=Maribacter luteocoastalis TaxID=3407671 RepID=UPI003B67B857